MKDATTETIDNSDLDLTGVPLRPPIIDKQWVLAMVKNLYWEAKANKATGKNDAKQLVIELVTQEGATSTEGKAVPPGFESTVNIWATPSGGLTQLMINQKVGRFQVAVLGLTEPTRFGSPDQYVGKLVKCYYEAESDKKDPTMLYQRVSRWEKAS